MIDTRAWRRGGDASAPHVGAPLLNVRLKCNLLLWPTSFGDLVIYRDLESGGRPPAAVRRTSGTRSAWTARCPRASTTWPTPAPLERLLSARKRVAPGWPRRARALAEIVYLGDTDADRRERIQEPADADRLARLVLHRRGKGREAGSDRARRAVPGRQPLERAGRLPRGVLAEDGAALDARTAVIVDIDKTALGARGRNDKSIDHARITAIEATLAEAIGPAFDQQRVPAGLRRDQRAEVPPVHRGQPGLCGLHLPDDQRGLGRAGRLAGEEMPAAG